MMPVGLKNSPATFTRLQELAIPPVVSNRILKICTDDMCVVAKTFDEPPQGYTSRKF